MINTQIRRIIGYVARTAVIAAIAGLTLFAGQAMAGEMQVAALSSIHATEASIRAANTDTARQDLQLEALADRLRASDAIGLFKKLAIKNKVNELARGFGYYHQGHRMADLKEALEQEGDFGQRVLDIDYDIYAEGEAELLGFYHSHPDHPARPSQYDLDHAWPFFSYVIVSVCGGVPEDMTSWRLKDDRSAFDQEDLTNA